MAFIRDNYIHSGVMACQYIQIRSRTMSKVHIVFRPKAFRDLNLTHSSFSCLHDSVIFIYAGQQVLLGESTYQEGRLEVDLISRNTPITILDFMTVLHIYRRSLEANILYIIFLPLRVCHNVEFLLNSILLIYLLTLPCELLLDNFYKIPYIKNISML